MPILCQSVLFTLLVKVKTIILRSSNFHCFRNRDRKLFLSCLWLNSSANWQLGKDCGNFKIKK